MRLPAPRQFADLVAQREIPRRDDQFRGGLRQSQQRLSALFAKTKVLGSLRVAAGRTQRPRVLVSNFGIFRMEGDRSTEGLNRFAGSAGSRLELPEQYEGGAMIGAARQDRLEQFTCFVQRAESDEALGTLNLCSNVVRIAFQQGPQFQFGFGKFELLQAGFD